MVRGSSYIDLPDWVKNKKAVINPKNEHDNECFKWAVVVALHHEDIGRDAQRISKIKPFSERYNWKGISFPTPCSEWKKFERQNPSVALNVLYIDGAMKIRQGYILSYNSKRAKIADLLIVEANGKKHYTAIKSLPALLRGVTSQHNGDSYCRNCLGSFRDDEARNEHLKVCKNHDFCRIDMPEEGKNILRYQEGSKSIRVPFVMYADTECILKPMAGTDPSTDGAFTRNVNEHVPCGVAFLTKFAHGEYTQDFKIHRGEDAIQMFFRTLISEVEWAIRYRKKEMIPLSEEQRAA